MFLKEHLTGNYDWVNATSVTTYNGSATRRRFDRYNGYQVLFLINLYISMTGRSSIDEGRKLEKLIIDHLPLQSQSEISVLNWLGKNVQL